MGLLERERKKEFAAHERKEAEREKKKIQRKKNTLRIVILIQETSREK